MSLRDLVFGGTILGVGTLLTAGLLRRPDVDRPPPPPPPPATRSADDLAGVIARVDASFVRAWDQAGLEPTPPADDWTRLRRLTLALTGAAPSLEEIRRFERLPEASRVERRLGELLADRRTADYLAERLARAYVGTEGGPFLLFRRRRFTTWLSDQILANRPYDAIVRDLIADEGLWTDHPATNFITVTRSEETELPDPERLAARVARAFLGVRLDCGQCHDHPFRPWQQADFRGLAGFFGAVHTNFQGARDGEPFYRPLDPKTHEPTDITPTVPFLAEVLPAEGTPRRRLAGWVTDPANPHLARATVNRVWALLFGIPLSDPVDDLPPEAEQPEALKLLAADFARSGYDLRRLIRVIAATAPFGLSSATVDGDAEGPTEAHEAAWAAFPLTRLRPEQVAGSLHQSAALTTIGPQSNWLVRLAAFSERNEFVQRYGDTGEDEFEGRGGTIPQRLLMLNGTLVQDRTRRDLFRAATRIAQQAPDDAHAVELAYLVVLTRRPGPDELEHFAAGLAGTRGDERAERLGDLFWTLLNSTEFSWNH